MEESRLKPGLAFVLSLVPGLGHVYAGSLFGAVIWLASTSFAYRAHVAAGFVAHFLCALSASAAAGAARNAERRELAGRRETAEEVGRMLGDVARRARDEVAAPLAAAVGAAAESRSGASTSLVYAFPVPAEVLRAAVVRGIRREGLHGVTEEADGSIGAVAYQPDGARVAFVATVEEVRATHAHGGTQSRVRLMMRRSAEDRPDAFTDESVLRGILAHVEEDPAMRAAAGPPAPAAPAEPPARSAAPGDTVTEDVFFDRLAESWEAREQGWMPEAEWREKKGRLVRALVLRSGTSVHDFMSACRPLVEAGVLDGDDLRAIERSVGR